MPISYKNKIYTTNGWLTSYKRKFYMGRNIEWNQLLDKSKFQPTTTINSVIFTNNGDGSIAVNGTANAAVYYRLDNTISVSVGHKLLIASGISGGSWGSYLLYDDANLSYGGFDVSGIGKIYTAGVSPATLYIFIDKDYTANNLVFKPQLFDLTKMFGAGNEPATPEEFWSYFDHKLYPYNAGETQPLFKISRKSQWGSAAHKGDLINIEGKQYRVLKTNGNIAEVLAMYDSDNLFAFGNDDAIYANSGIDTYCNSTFYGALSASMKNAIVEKTFTQDKWSLTSGTSGGTGNVIYTGIDSNSSQYQIGLMSTTYGTSISRKCYALSVQDVLDYLNVTTSMTAANTMLNSTNIWKMFWNQTTDSSDYIWLRSACYYDETDGLGFIADGDYGSLNYGDPIDTKTIRPAFQIDLSKVSWSPVSSG